MYGSAVVYVSKIQKQFFFHFAYLLKFLLKENNLKKEAKNETELAVAASNNTLSLTHIHTFADTISYYIWCLT